MTPMKETISRLEEKISSAVSMDSASKKELLDLLTSLRSEMEELSDDRLEEAESIAGFVHLSAHEAIRETKNPKLQKLASDGLSSSVEGFEASHPKLVSIVNSISILLSNVGI